MDGISLNAMQRLFRGWDAVHPYNAAQAFKLRGPQSPDAAQRAWNDALAALAIGHVSVSGNRLVHTAASSPQPLHLAAENLSLEDYFSSELDRPFVESDFSPFRPFILREGDGAWFGVIYRHWIADSVSIRMLMREWYKGISTPGPQPAQCAAQIADGYWRLFVGNNGNGGLHQSVKAFIAGHQRLRGARKPLTRGSADYPSRVLVRHAPDGLIAAVRERCHINGVRVSDVMLAALLEAASGHIPLQSRPSRRGVAVGCMVDLRPHARRKIDQTFGLFLGFTSIVCPTDQSADWPRLLESVVHQTEAHRRRGIAATCTAWIGAALACRPFIPRRQMYHFYRKTMPLAAGLSSVNLNRSWPMEFFPSPLTDYVRISPTGPIAPVVLSATELGPRLTLALTYRANVINARSAEAIIESMIQRLADARGLPSAAKKDMQPSPLSDPL